MTTVTELVADDQVEFSIYGNINSSSTFRGTVAGIVSGRFVPTTANPDVNHTNIYPSLPDSKKAIYSDDYSSYKYLHLRTENETDVYIGFPWVKDATISMLAVATYTIVLTDFDTDRQTEVIQALKQRGFTVGSTSLNTGSSS